VCRHSHLIKIEKLTRSSSIGGPKVTENTLDRLQAEIEEGDTGAMVELGRINELKRNFAEAFRLYTLAVEGGSVVGEISLGRLYAEGLGVKKSRSKAAVLYKQVRHSIPLESPTRFSPSSNCNFNLIFSKYRLLMLEIR